MYNMMKMNITVIIPVHKYDDKISSYLNKAIESIIINQNTELPQVIIVHPLEINKEIVEFMESQVRKFGENFPESKYTLLINEGKTDYQSQVNFAVESVTTDYFSVLEFDDEYSKNYFKNVIEHIEAYPDVDIFLTMMIEVNDRNEGMKLTNETVWAQQFVGENGEMGYLNPTSLKQYTDFKLSGATIKKSEFKNIGKYKTNIKLSFMYELLLRALNNACKIYTIPKIGYKHLATREDSLFGEYSKTMPMNERKFWFDTATNEANFINDRVIDLTRLTKQIVT